MSYRASLTLVAPGLRVGRGLERIARVGRLPRVALRPAFGSGEDWNNPVTVKEANVYKLRPAFGSGEDWNECVLKRYEEAG